MTRKDYVLIANVLNQFTAEGGIVTERDAIAYDFAHALALENPRFDRERFLIAAGVWDKARKEKGEVMNQNTIVELIVKIEAEAKEAGQNLEEAQKLEEEGDYSDAMISMDRTYAEGFSDALDLVLRILKSE